MRGSWGGNGTSYISEDNKNTIRNEVVAVSCVGVGLTLNRIGKCKRDLQELVEERKEAREKHSHDPEAESHDRQAWFILVGYDGSNLGDGRVLFLIEDDGGVVIIDLLVDENFVSSVFLLVAHGGGGREKTERR